MGEVNVTREKSMTKTIMKQIFLLLFGWILVKQTTKGQAANKAANTVGQVRNAEEMFDV